MAAPKGRGASAQIGVSHPHRRVRLLLIGTFMVFSLFAAQLVRLQGLDAASVSALAFDQRLDEVIIPATRGVITDVDGEPLAVDEARVDIEVDPTNVGCYGLSRTECESDPQARAAAVSRAATEIAAVTGEDAGTLEATITDIPGRWGRLLRGVPAQTWHEVQALGIPGITGVEHYRRSYPLGAALAPLVGWLGSGEAPAGGVELTRDEELTGEPGEQSFEVGGGGEVISTGTSVHRPAVPGQDVRLTIDSDLQWYAYDAVQQRVEESGALSGYALVQEVETGRLVAAASYPAFDPDDPIQSGEEMRNAVIEDVYEPGSTAKLITAAAALETGLVEPETLFVVPDRLPREGESFKDAHDPDTPYLNFAGVLATSSNMGTILYGEQLPDDTFYDYLRKFGLGTPSGLGLPGESAGVVPEPQDWSRTSKFTMMFGQGMSGNALQQLGVYQTVANGGVHLPPSVVAGVTDVEGRYTRTPVPDGERVIETDTAATLNDILMQVPTPDGTAPTATIDGYHVAGKTSTADRYDYDLGRYSRTTASFIGYAPAEDPQYVVAVTVQAPTRISVYGGTIAGPVFADIMRYALQQAGVEPTDEPVPELELTYDPKQQAPGESPGTTLEDIAIADERSDE